MRDLDAALLTTQVTGNAVPAFQAVFTDRTGSTTYDYSFDPDSRTNRLENIMYRLEPFADYAHIEYQPIAWKEG